MIPPNPDLNRPGVARPSLPAQAHSLSFWAAGARALTADAATSVSKRVKFFLRAWLQRRFTRAWLARLVQPDLVPLWQLRPRLATKLQRAYICCAWGVPERCAALLGHYDVFPRLFAAEARLAIFRDGLTVLSLANEKSGRRLELRLLYNDRFEKEGELTLVLGTAEGVLLAGLSFCLVRAGDATLAIIGGLQAGNDPRVRDLIPATAREMHGLRPKACVLWCLQQLMEPWGISQLQGVGDEQHVWRHWRNRRQIAACYDEFWAESGGCELPGGGGWELPLTPVPRERAALKATRRRAHELRYAMLAELQPVLRTAFAGLAHGLPAAPPAFVYAGREGRPPEERIVLPEVLAVTNHSF